MRSASSTPSTADPSHRVARFVCEMRAAYQRLAEAPTPGTDPDLLDERLVSLTLAEAALRYQTSARPRPPQLAILGPTQTGKSSVVNWLIGRCAAEVSPLAGFTVHPQAFALGVPPSESSWRRELFPGWRPEDRPEQLQADDLAAWSYTSITTPAAGMPDCIVWDTPDFDSLAARTYRRGVVETAALADAILLVLSKEKYSDLSVWRLLRRLAPLGTPLVVVLNKMTPDAEALIRESCRPRLAELCAAWRDCPLISIPYAAKFQEPADQLHDETPITDLRSAAADALRAGRSRDRQAGVRRLIRGCWADWTEPLLAEHAALARWEQAVDEALRDFVEHYQRDFLDHPQRYDSFRRATIELLVLLEVPGLGGVLSSIRNVVTWPARKLFGWGASLFRGAPRSTAGASIGSEQAILTEMIERLLIRLDRDTARSGEPGREAAPVWRALRRRLEQHEPDLRQSFQQAVRSHAGDVDHEIHVAANELFETLQKRPALLNSLRAARVTTDVAAIALAVKTGGLHPNDLIFAPAVLAVTTMLTESALGGYMLSIQEGLKSRQLQNVQSKLVDETLRPRLYQLSDALDGPAVLGLGATELAETEAALERWERDG